MSILLRHFDLNLLRMLQALYNTRSVSKAGMVLGLSQPASSNALARLRDSIGDPLFVRTRDGMEPTAYVEEIAPLIIDHIDAIAAILDRGQVFDPKTSTQIFRLSLSGLGEANFLPRLSKQILSAAPKSKVFNVSAPLEDLAEALRLREADIAIGIVNIEERGIRSVPLFQDAFAIISRPGSKLAKLHFDDLQETRIILTAPTTTFAARIEEALLRNNLAENVVLRLRYFSAIPQILNELDAVAIVPRDYADNLKDLGLADILPAQLPIEPFDIKMVWHDKTTNDLACKWLRSLIVDLFTRG
jgi:DNA-binding transcriptional LysR family regulator